MMLSTLWRTLEIVNCKTWNYLQTIQTTHKPPKPHTNELNYPKTTHKPAKPPTITCKLATPPTNYPQTRQIPHKAPTNHPKIAPFFSWRHFLWLGINSGPKNCNICHPVKYDPFTHPSWKMGAFFYISARFRISPSPWHSSFTYSGFIEIKLKNFLTFSFNPFATLV